MTPNCQPCNIGNHEACDQTWCECRTFNHVPTHLIALARALGVDDDALRDTLNKFPTDHTWYVLLDQVRELTNRDCPGHPVKDDGKTDGKADGDPFKVRARERVEEFSHIDRVVMDVGVDDTTMTADGRVVRHTGRGTLTIEGTLP